jgi:quercetin dioxygenase-like cupin family protein
VIDKAETRPVAWAVERADHGRAFTFTGLHYLIGLDDPSIRTLLLNAIVWTAHLDVPADGVHSAAAGDLAKKVVDQELQLTGVSRRSIKDAIVIPASQAQVLPQPWGQLTWYVSGALKNSDTMTIGQAIINPGQENPRHYHPNCDEVLHVIKGHILHSMGDRTVEMHDGDTVSIPAGVHHNAKNLGTEPAILSISFSSADRIAIGE